MRKSQGAGSGRHDSSGADESKYNTLVHAVFLAVLLGAGTIIWRLVDQGAAADKRITLLEYRCLLPPGTRPAVPQ